MPSTDGLPPGDGLSEWRIDDADPTKSVPTEQQRDSNPLQFGYHLMDLAEKGGVAVKKGDHHAAVKYYAALAKAVPDRSVAFTKLCASHEALGDWEKAVEACRTALGLPGVTVADSSHFVRLLLAKRGALSATEIDDATAVVTHLGEEETTRGLSAELQCEIGSRLEDVKRLESCTTALAKSAPDDARTISYQWALALARKDYAGAHAVIDHAKVTKMPPEGIRHMEAATLAAEPLWRKAWRDWRVSAGATVILTAALALRLARRRSMITVGS
jgi:tetratricopeptide (TPR) repeat protein